MRPLGFITTCFLLLWSTFCPAQDQNRQSITFHTVEIDEGSVKRSLANASVCFLNDNGTFFAAESDKHGLCTLGLPDITGFAFIDTTETMSNKNLEEKLFPCLVRVAASDSEFGTKVTLYARRSSSYRDNAEAIQQLSALRSVLEKGLRSTNKDKSRARIRILLSRIAQRISSRSQESSLREANAAPENATTTRVKFQPVLLGQHSDPSIQPIALRSHISLGFESQVTRWCVLDAFNSIVVGAAGVSTLADSEIEVDLIPGNLYTLVIVTDPPIRLSDDRILPPEMISFCPVIQTRFLSDDPFGDSSETAFDVSVAMYRPPYYMSKDNQEYFMSHLRVLQQTTLPEANKAKLQGDLGAPILIANQQAQALIDANELRSKEAAIKASMRTPIASLSALFGTGPEIQTRWEVVRRSALAHRNTNFWIIARTSDVGSYSGWQNDFAPFLVAQRNLSNFKIAGYVSALSYKSDNEIMSELTTLNGPGLPSIPYTSGVFIDNFGTFPMDRRLSLYQAIKQRFGPNYTVMGAFGSAHELQNFGAVPACDVMVVQKGAYFDSQGISRLRESRALSHIGAMTLGVPQSEVASTLESIADARVSFVSLTDFNVDSPELMQYDKFVNLPSYWEQLCDALDKHNAAIGKKIRR